MPPAARTFFGSVFASFCGIVSLLSSIRTVSQNHVQLVERFGKYVKTLESGLHVLTPFVEKVIADISLAMQNLVFDADAVTKDKVLVKVRANLVYSIDGASVTKYFY